MERTRSNLLLALMRFMRRAGKFGVSTRHLLFIIIAPVKRRIQVPKYKSWHWLFMPTKSFAAFLDGHSYSIETDFTDEKICLKRYKAVWKKPNI